MCLVGWMPGCWIVWFFGGLVVLCLFVSLFVCLSVAIGSSCLGSSEFTLNSQETLGRVRGVISAEACSRSLRLATAISDVARACRSKKKISAEAC